MSDGFNFCNFYKKHSKGSTELWANKIYSPSTELTISKPKCARNKCCRVVPKVALSMDSFFIIPDNPQYKHKVFFMMHKCSLSHPKLEKTKSWKHFFYYKFMQKPNSFVFIKCRNFYVFLINAILRQLRGHICYYFNEKRRNISET